MDGMQSCLPKRKQQAAPILILSPKKMKTLFIQKKDSHGPMYSKILSDGSFVTLSHSFEPGQASLIKHSANGVYDESFGVVISEKIRDLEKFTARNSLVTEDNDIILLGAIKPDTGPPTALLARFSANGDLDKKFRH